jgi:hypothetical protein
MMTKVPYLLHARADEDLRSGPLTATDTRQDLVPAVRTEERRGQATFPDLPLAGWTCTCRGRTVGLSAAGWFCRPSYLRDQVQTLPPPGCAP